MTDVTATSAPSGRATVGILVGGKATRMKGVAKGLLPTADGVPIVTRTARIFEAVGADAVLLGNAAAYADTGLPSLADEPGFDGPLAGLLALLRRSTTTRVLLVGGDMPFVTSALALRLVELLDAHEAVAAHDGERFLPLFAGFSGAAVRRRVEDAVRDGARSPSAVLRALDAARLRVSPDELAALADWDTPEDVATRSES